MPPTSLPTISDQEFHDPAWQSELWVELKALAEQGNRQLFRDFLEALEKRGASLKDGLPGELQGIHRYLQFAALPTLDETTALEIMKTHAIWALRQDVDLRTQVHDLLDRYHDDLTGWENRRAILAALRASQERIGDQGASSRTGEWLRRYDRLVGVERSRGSLERSKFLTTAPEARMLGTDDRRVLTHLLELYDFLRFEPSDALVIKFKQAGGRWDEQGNPVLPKAASVSAGVIPPAGFMQDAPAQGDDLARLRFLAREGNIEKILDDASLKMQSQQWPAQRATRVALGLRMILEQQMRLRSSEAAKIAVELANLSAAAGHSEYLDIAYFDDATKTFRWKE